MINSDTLSSSSDELTRVAKNLLPDAELYELAALFLSMGSFLLASSIPEFWPQLKPIAELSHELLNQEELKAKWDNSQQKQSQSSSQSLT